MFRYKDNYLFHDFSVRSFTAEVRLYERKKLHVLLTTFTKKNRVHRETSLLKDQYC